MRLIIDLIFNISGIVMIVTVGSWFNEPGISFKISYRVHNLIREFLVNKIMKPYGLEERDTQFLLNLVTATSLKTKELDVRGPEINKRGKAISYGLWLPYEKITSSSTYLETYLHYYFNALVIVFKNYDVPEQSIRDTQKLVEEKVLNDEMYAYKE